MKTFPADLVFYKKTPEFTADSTPKGLLKDHSTKEGVWGKIIVLSGKLEYTILEPTVKTIELNPATYGIVEPMVKHYIKPLGSVTFHVEFFR